MFYTSIHGLPGFEFVLQVYLVSADDVTTLFTKESVNAGMYAYLGMFFREMQPIA
jgi:Uri superfamily endonuclease